ncbi:MAG TPA: hypothetical protein V6D48_11410 [Oculatellaceae cyanobacterium]
MRNKLIKAVIVSAAASAVALGSGATPAAAQATSTPSSSNNPLTQIFDSVKSQLEGLRSYADKILNDKLSSLTKVLGEDVAGVVDDAFGALGLPDVIESRQEIEQLSSNSERPIYAAEAIANEVDRQAARAVINSVLGKEGQERQLEAYSSTQQAVNAVVQQAQAAQGEVVTQNVMKQIALQNAQNGGLLGAMRADLLRSAEAQAQGNTQLTNISRSVDGQNARDNAERVGAGFSNFRTAAQAGLF